MAAFLLGAIPPLTDDQRVRLETAYDGRDHQEAAFVALLENARRWTGGLGEAPVRLHPDLEAMLGEPQAYRGELCRIAGRLEQQARLPIPYQGVTEWFVRDEAGRPILVYVDGLALDHPVREGRQVTIIARFYKRIDGVGRDGEPHRYPAFVGALPSFVAAGEGSWLVLWAVAVPVGIMFLIFLILVVLARSRDRRRPHPVRSGSAATVEAWEPLPDDPAEALAELRRRAETPP